MQQTVELEAETQNSDVRDMVEPCYFTLPELQADMLCTLTETLSVLPVTTNPPTLISTIPPGVKLRQATCLGAPRVTAPLSGQLPMSSAFVSGTTVMIRPAPTVTRFSHQMAGQVALVQSAGTTLRAPFITQGTVLPPGAKLLAHVPAQFVPIVTGMPRGKAPSTGAITSTSGAASWMATMQPILPAGGAISTSHPSTVGLSSAPPGGSVVTSAEGTKQAGSEGKAEPGPGASSPSKENAGEKKDSGNEGSDFDPVSAMEWKDGVGQLPGSDLKVGSYPCSDKNRNTGKYVYQMA